MNKIWIRTSVDRKEFESYLFAKAKMEKKEARILKTKHIILGLVSYYIKNSQYEKDKKQFQNEKSSIAHKNTALVIDFDDSRTSYTFLGGSEKQDT